MTFFCLNAFLVNPRVWMCYGCIYESFFRAPKTSGVLVVSWLPLYLRKIAKDDFYIPIGKDGVPTGIMGMEVVEKPSELKLT